MSQLPPWRVAEWELDKDFEKIAQQWGPLRRILEDATLFDRTDPEVSAWSCGQHAGHSLLVTRLMSDRIEDNLAEPRQNEDEETWDIAVRVMTAGGFPRGAAESPPDVLPDGRGREEFLSLLDDAIASWERLSARGSELPGCPARALHPRLKWLTSVEWVRMCAVHTAHHLALVRDIAGDEAVS